MGAFSCKGIFTNPPALPPSPPPQTLFLHKYLHPPFPATLFIVLAPSILDHPIPFYIYPHIPLPPPPISIPSSSFCPLQSFHQTIPPSFTFTLISPPPHQLAATLSSKDFAPSVFPSSHPAPCYMSPSSPPPRIPPTSNNLFLI
jgi:hypothetical protein